MMMTTVSGIDAYLSDPVKNFLKPRLNARVRPVFGHFIPMMSSLADGQGGREGDKELLTGKAAAKGRAK
jgi:hypothetical protein